MKKELGDKIKGAERRLDELSRELDSLYAVEFVEDPSFQGLLEREIERREIIVHEIEKNLERLKKE